MRHPHYAGRKAETVASVGSRLAGTVKPSYGKPKLVLESNPLKLTGDTKSFGFNSIGPADLGAKSPYRLTRRVSANVAEIARLNRFAHKQGKQASKRQPKLIKVA